MNNTKHIHLRMYEDDLKIINEIIQNQSEYYQIVIHRNYGYTDAIKQGLNLLHDVLITHKYRLEPNTEEEQKELISQDEELKNKPANYKNNENINCLCVDFRGNYTIKNK